MKVLITGANGFIAKTLIVRLGGLDSFEIIPFLRQTLGDQLNALNGITIDPKLCGGRP